MTQRLQESDERFLHKVFRVGQAVGSGPGKGEQPTAESFDQLPPGGLSPAADLLNQVLVRAATGIHNATTCKLVHDHRARDSRPRSSGDKLT